MLVMNLLITVFRWLERDTTILLAEVLRLNVRLCIYVTITTSGGRTAYALVSTGEYNSRWSWEDIVTEGEAWCTYIIVIIILLT